MRDGRRRMAAGAAAALPELDREPALLCPFDAADCPAPQVRLTRRCVNGGRLRFRTRVIVSRALPRCG